MAIDPRLYEKHSGRKGDPQTRLGEVLATDAKEKQERDGLPKGVQGGLEAMGDTDGIMPVWLWLRDRERNKGGRAGLKRSGWGTMRGRMFMLGAALAGLIGAVYFLFFF